eukprot:scaffold40674_cov36-Cyclotella_meneghiniana.AAC.1
MTTATSENKSNAGDSKNNADVEMKIVSSEKKKSDAEDDVEMTTSTSENKSNAKSDAKMDTQIAGAYIGSVETETNNSTDRLI